MSNLPVLKPAEVISILRKLGFAEVRQRGSHIQFRHAGGRGTTVPFHKGGDILNVYTGINRDDADSGGFIVRHRRFHFDGKRWIKYERIEKDGYWEDEFDFPKLSKFPKVSKR